ncbi:bis(5'-nucleosyl)-tetraphosphatase (symmetrical) YqeK [Pseudolactococcus insecticola]|uniref:bis(5'-nucleosyl)-tetraphosphatase (symmetrical) n=1 Tax=Pseudolactococcus insecticola TaxID=2709158 RepID=A0A6A0B5C8_9LACT|nr:bis(5'-nucleosyl)-tetraphosphatase (symmetrical) YqeK [Lactococcus insecticola]GFH40432.1 HD domain-containing protein [Lactococcus insecticola]
MAFDYYPEVLMTRDALLEKLANNMSEKRFRHVQNVGKAAAELAERWGYENVQKAELAGLLHDYAKEESEATFKSLIAKYQLEPELLNWGNNVWHGMVGIYKIQEDLGLTDPEILRAIEIHTVGDAKMTLLDKIVYVADYVESGRSFEGVELARELAYKKSLDAAVAYETAQTVNFLSAKRERIYPQTLATYNAFIHAIKAN